MAEDPNLTRFSLSQYNEAINIAQQEFAFESKALWKDAPTYTVVDGTAAYNLPADFWLEKIVTHKGLELKPVSRATLLKDNGDDWSDDSGTPTHYMVDPEAARGQIRLYPIPQGDDAGANLILSYYPVPADVPADNVAPLNASALMGQFHLGIAAYAAWLLLGYADATQAIMLKRNDLMKQYQAKVTMAIDTFKNTASEPMRMPTIHG